jgi:cold shock CspA family protein
MIKSKYSAGLLSLQPPRVSSVSHAVADGGPDCFFHWSDVNEADFNELAEAMTGTFLGPNNPKKDRSREM